MAMPAKNKRGSPRPSLTRLQQQIEYCDQMLAWADQTQERFNKELAAGGGIERCTRMLKRAAVVRWWFTSEKEAAAAELERLKRRRGRA